MVGMFPVAGVDAGRQQHRHAEDDGDLDELGGLEAESADDQPGVGAVDGGAQRGEDQQDQQHRDAVEDRDGGPEGAVAQPDGARHQRDADAGVEQVADEEEVRVALVEPHAVAGGGVDEDDADQGEGERAQQHRPVEPAHHGVAGERLGPGGAFGPVAGDGEAGHQSRLQRRGPPPAVARSWVSAGGEGFTGR